MPYVNLTSNHHVPPCPPGIRVPCYCPKEYVIIQRYCPKVYVIMYLHNVSIPRAIAFHKFCVGKVRLHSTRSLHRARWVARRWLLPRTKLSVVPAACPHVSGLCLTNQSIVIKLIMSTQFAGRGRSLQVGMPLANGISHHHTVNCVR